MTIICDQCKKPYQISRTLYEEFKGTTIGHTCDACLDLNHLRFEQEQERNNLIRKCKNELWQVRNEFNHGKS